MFSSALLSKAQISKFVPFSPNLDSTDVEVSTTEQKRYPGRARQYALTRRKERDPHEAIAQFIPFSGGTTPSIRDSSARYLSVQNPQGLYGTIFGCLEHPWSRGAVHIISADASVYPAIDPQYLSNPRDLDILKTVMLFAQKVLRSEPLASLFKGGGKVYQPGFTELTTDNVEHWIRSSLSSVYHPIGTCSMEPRDKGGVVDPRLKVYGTSNLRVVDAS